MSFFSNKNSNSFKNLYKNKSINNKCQTISIEKSNGNNKSSLLNITNKNLNKSYSQSKFPNYKYYLYKYNSEKNKIYTSIPEYVHNAARKIQSVFKGYLFRNFFFYNLESYYNTHILFNILNEIFLKFCFNKFIINLKSTYKNKINNKIFNNEYNINISSIPKIFLKNTKNFPVFTQKVLSNSFSIINNESRKQRREENKKIKELEKELKEIKSQLKEETEEKRKLIIQSEYMKMELMHLRIDVVNVKNENRDLERLNEKYLMRIEKLKKGENIDDNKKDFEEEEEILSRFKPFARIKYKKYNK